MNNILNLLNEMIYVTDPETDEIIFINDHMRQHYGIEGEVVGALCYKVFQDGINERCSFCPCRQLDKEPPGSTIVWEEHSTLTKRVYRNTDRYTTWPDRPTKVHFQHSVDITELVRAQDLLIAREKMMNSLNHAAATFLTSNMEYSFEEMMSKGVLVIADTIAIDRLSIWRNFAKPDGLHSGQIYRWDRVSGGTTIPTEGLENIAYATHAPGWEKLLSNGETINSPVTLLPEAELLHSFGVVSVCVVPLFNNRIFWGFALFEDRQIERFFDKDSMETMNAAAFLCFNAILRNDMERVAVEEKIAKESAERIKIMLNATPLASRLWNKEYRIFECNDKALRLFGHPNKQEFMDKYATMSPEYQPDGQLSSKKSIEKLKLAFQGSQQVFEWVHLLPDGTLLPVEITLERVEYQNDYAVAGYTRDLRESKTLLEKIQNEKDKFREAAHWYESILDAIPVIVTVQDLDRNFSFINHTAEVIFEKNRQELIGNQCKHLGLSICDTENCSIECSNRGQSQTYFVHNNATYQSDVKLLTDLHGTVYGHIELIQDITKMENMGRRQAEYEAALEMLEMQEKQEKAEAASAAKSEFLANMSHEIRTPMNSIIGFADLAFSEVMSPKAKDYLKKIIDNSRLLLLIINDILDISKVESGNMTLEHIPFDLQELLANCQSIIYPKALEKGIELRFFSEAIIRKQLYGDPLRIRQVLLNLLSNAVKFTDGGQVSFFAYVLLLTDDKATIYFEVIDSGIGMTQDQIATITLPFAQADTSTTRKYGGTGLGLSISNSLLHLMGSELEIESIPGKGSKFGFRITLDIATEKTEKIENDPISGEFARPMFVGDILVCEDNKMNQNVITEHLKKIGISSEIAENGSIAINMVKERIKTGKKPFDLIFMDVQMPVMDGFEATPKIVALGTGTPIIALTADVLSTDRDLYQSFGMVDCLTKPFTSKQLWTCLLRYMKPKNFEQTTEKDDIFQQQLQADFIRNNHDVFYKTTKAIDSGDVTLAYRLMHSLKSNAGLLGKTKLQKTADALTNAIKNKQDVGEELDVLQYELNKVLDELKLLVGEVTPASGNGLNSIDIKVAQKLFSELEPLLRKGSPGSLKFLADLRKIPGSEVLVAQIEEFYFSKALEALSILKKNMGID